MRGSKSIGLTGLFITFAVGISDLSEAAPNGEKLYHERSCDLCHGADAMHPTNNEYPKLRGQNADYLFNQLLAFKRGERTNSLASLMVPMVEGIPDRELKAIADWIAALGHNSKVVEGLEVQEGVAHRVVVSKLNIRKNPSKDAPVIGSIGKGEIIQVIGEKDGWAKIGPFHWVWGSLISPN